MPDAEDLYPGYGKVVVPIFWYQNDCGDKIYDLEEMRKEFEHELKKLQLRNDKAKKRCKKQ